MAQNTDSQFSRSSRMEAMREMASAVSFDLTDLTTVIGFKISGIRKALEQGSSPPTLLQDIERIEAALARLQKLAKGMRSLGLAGEQDGFQLTPLPELVSKVLDLSHAWFEVQNIDFRAEEIPEVIVRCRPSQLSQAVINLLNNAIDATAPLPQKWVNLGFTLEGSAPICLKISVTDSGKMAPEISQKMLEPFFSTKVSGRGIGLGLNVVKSVAEAHSGKLYLDSSHPQTRFILEIPVVSLPKEI